MLKVGLTGGIGSGKSTIAKIFEALGVPVYSADQAAKEVIANDPSVRSQLIKLFGEKAFEGGSYNRQYISERVFGNKDLLQKLNAIVHPATFEHFKKWFASQDSPYIIKEAAIMFESGSHKTVDEVITVTSPMELRIDRIAARDKSKREEIRRKMESQMSDEERIKLSQHVIYNDDDHALIPQVLKLHNKFLGKE